MSWAIEISRSVEHTGWADEMGRCKEHATEARCHGKGDEDDDDDDDDDDMRMMTTTMMTMMMMLSLSFSLSLSLSTGAETFATNQQKLARELRHSKDFAPIRITAQGECMRGVRAESVVPVHRL